MFLLSRLLQAEATCESCLQDHKRQFWCVSSQKCMPLEQIAECPNKEHHDLILNATKCCSPIQTQDECLGGENINFCLWCPAHVQQAIATGGPGVEVQGQCMYKSDIDNLKANCQTEVDLTSPCSSYKTCQECSKDIPCAWCGSKNKCVSQNLGERLQYAFGAEFGCADDLQHFDSKLDQCVCDSGYYDAVTGHCRQCPNSLSVSLDRLSCDCGKENQLFNNRDQQCHCTDNTYNDSGNCIQCPKDAASNGKTCVCFDSNAVFDRAGGKCRCRSDAVRVEQKCIVCPSCATPDAQQQFCKCPGGQVWFIDKNECVGERAGSIQILKLGIAATISGILLWAIRRILRARM